MLAGILGFAQAGWTQSAHYREARERFDKGELLLAMLAALLLLPSLLVLWARWHRNRQPG